MDFSNKTKDELISLCKERKIKGYSGKKKEDIIQLLLQGNSIVKQVNEAQSETINNSINEGGVIGAQGPSGTVVERSSLTLSMIDLFSGTGAFTYAFENTKKVKCVFSNDMVEWSKEIYDSNFDHKLTLGNLNDIDVNDIPSHDILTGGFPCQPFSIAGKQQGFDDERSNVFWKILAIIDKHSPSFVILENVKNLLSHDEGNTFETIQNNLSIRGYHIRYKVLNTSDITGIPQHRERIYIVCIKSKEIHDKFTLDFPTVTKLPISSMLESSVAEKYYYTDKSSTWPLVSASVVNKDTIYQYRRVYVRENKSNECPTLTANMGSGGHNVPLVLDEKGIRKLTPRECFNFQGFPSTYVLPKLSDCNLYKLAGNAVSIPVVRLIAERLMSLVD
jgi:DNA (cytosine-5)-methyltransferase 1